MKRFLVLSDGSVYEGAPLGAEGTTVGEVVFNTGMTGYQEILTDPSYAGQLVTLTYPLIGNYGINDDDFESDRVQPTGLIVREAEDEPSNWRASKSLHQFLTERGTVAIQGLDTRALTKKIRDSGVLMGCIAPSVTAAQSVLTGAASYGEIDFVREVTTARPYKWGPEGKEELDVDDRGRPLLAVLDCGLKHNILRRFWKAGCRPLVFPAGTSADEILSHKPAGVLLSPGPGDPARLLPVVRTVKKLLGQRPIFGICLGNQMLCHAVGGETFKLKFGHRGSNHPVKDLRTGAVTITSQNHGYAVSADGLPAAAEVTQINLNDGTVEGIRIPGADAESIQYHPEAAPGPWDSRPYFASFVERLKS